MPAVSERQREFMGAELRRKRAGKKTRTGMSEKQLREFAGSVKGKRSTKGSKPFTEAEMRKGYRCVAKY